MRALKRWEIGRKDGCIGVTGGREERLESSLDTMG